MALTDHNMVNHINHCSDVPMTILSGIERDLRLPGRAADKPHCVHVVGVACPMTPLRPGRTFILVMRAMANPVRMPSR